MNEGWQRRNQGSVDYPTKAEAKDRLWGELGLTVDLLKLFDQLCWLWDHQALSHLPRVDLVSDCDFWLDHYVAISPQGLDVALYGGLVPHDIVDVGIEDYWIR